MTITIGTMSMFVEPLGLLGVIGILVFFGMFLGVAIGYLMGGKNEQGK